MNENDPGRVRKNTSTNKNAKIDQLIQKNIEKYSKDRNGAITRRIKTLNRSWDVERMLEANMATLALSGLALSMFLSKKWLFLPSVVLGFFIQHAIQGWCPPLPLFRAFNVRTRAEIDEEKFALKALRGDFENIKTPLDAFNAVKRN